MIKQSAKMGSAHDLADFSIITNDNPEARILNIVRKIITGFSHELSSF